MWAPLFEKAWAKLRGSYLSSDGGFVQNGMKAMLGCPVFTYFVSEEDPEATWRYLKILDEIGEFVIGAATTGVSDQTYNSFGVTNAHAFSVISVFALYDEFGKE